MLWNEVKFYLTQTCAKIMDVDRVIKNNTLFFTPKHENILSETGRVKALGIFFIIIMNMALLKYSVMFNL